MPGVVRALLESPPCQGRPAGSAGRGRAPQRERAARSAGLGSWFLIFKNLGSQRAAFKLSVPRRIAPAARVRRSLGHAFGLASTVRRSDGEPLAGPGRAGADVVQAGAGGCPAVAREGAALRRTAAVDAAHEVDRAGAAGGRIANDARAVMVRAAALRRAAVGVGETAGDASQGATAPTGLTDPRRSAVGRAVGVGPAAIGSAESRRKSGRAEGRARQTRHHRSPRFAGTRSRCRSRRPRRRPARPSRRRRCPPFPRRARPRCRRRCPPFPRRARPSRRRRCPPFPRRVRQRRSRAPPGRTPRPEPSPPPGPPKLGP